MKVAVIGGGLGGLAAACVLGARGHEVTLYDKNGWLGGKAAVLEEGGFRFDMGPTILTVPRVLERIFAEAGRELARPPALIRLDPQWRCFFDDGGRLDLIEDVDAMAAAMDRFAPGKGVDEGYRRFLDLAQHLHDVSGALLLLEAGRGHVRHHRPQGQPQPVDPARRARRCAWAARWPAPIRAQVKDGRLAQMLDHFTQYVGSSPYGSPAVLCAIAHMQAAEGVWYPVGGTRAVATALAKLAAELGGDLRTGEEVTRPRRRGRRGPRRADRPRCGRRSTPWSPTWTRCGPTASWSAAPRPRPTTGKGFEPACSGVVLYLGLYRRYEHLAHHDFVFSRDPRGGVRLHLQARRAGPRPDLLPRRPLGHRPHGGARGRRGALRPGPHALPAPAPRLVAHVPRLPPGHPRQAEAHRPAWRTSRSGSWSSGTSRRRTSTTATRC